MSDIGHRTRVPSSGCTLGDLDAQIDAFLRQPRLSDSTLNRYEKAWPTWVRFCAARGFDPLNAPPHAMLRLVAACSTGDLRSDPSDGPLSPSTMRVLIAAIGHVLHQQDRQRPDQRDPVVAARLTLVRSGYRRWFGRNRSGPAHQTAPLRLPDVSRITQTSPSPPEHRARVLAARLLMLQHQVPAGPAAAVRVDAFQAGETATLAVDGVAIELSCTHTVDPTTCLSCLLRNVSEGRAHDELLFASGPEKRLRRRLIASLRSWVSYWPGLRLENGMVHLDPDQISLELACRIATFAPGSGELGFLRLRAMLLLAWSRGLRGDDICLRLRRRDLTRTSRGYRLELRTSKGDQDGDGRVMSVRPARDRSVCPVAALDEWLMVSDAASTDPDRPLFCSIVAAGGALDPDRPVSVKMWRLALDVAGQRAGVTEVFTTRSARAGFAVMAHEQGATLQQIQDVLRHAQPETTLVYLASAGVDSTSGTVAAVLRRPE